MAVSTYEVQDVGELISLDPTSIDPNEALAGSLVHTLETAHRLQQANGKRYVTTHPICGAGNEVGWNNYIDFDAPLNTYMHEGDRPGPLDRVETVQFVTTPSTPGGRERFFKAHFAYPDTDKNRPSHVILCERIDKRSPPKNPDGVEVTGRDYFVSLRTGAAHIIDTHAGGISTTIDDLSPENIRALADSIIRQDNKSIALLLDGEEAGLRLESYKLAEQIFRDGQRRRLRRAKFVDFFARVKGLLKKDAA